MILLNDGIVLGLSRSIVWKLREDLWSFFKFRMHEMWSCYHVNFRIDRNGLLPFVWNFHDHKRGSSSKAHTTIKRRCWNTFTWSQHFYFESHKQHATKRANWGDKRLFTTRDFTRKSKFSKCNGTTQTWDWDCETNDNWSLEGSLAWLHSYQNMCCRSY